MAKQNSMRNVQVEQLISEIVYGTFESQAAEVYPRVIAIMGRLADDASLAMSFEDDFEMLTGDQNVPMNADMFASVKRSRPIVSYLIDIVVLSWIDPEDADELMQFRIDPLALVQIEDLKDDEEN